MALKDAQDYAIQCTNVAKEFYLLGDDLNWRIVFKDKIKNFEVYKVLKNINLEVPKGKFVGVLGRNGAGKSTLLRVLGGVYAATQGIVSTYGEISALFELGGMSNERLSGKAYANRFLEFYGINKKNRKNLLQNILEFSELKENFDLPIYTYSSGMKARLYFSTATELQHTIYLVDELLSVGDEHFQAKCWKRLRERFLNGASGILVTHDWPAVLKLCSHSCILEDGRVIAAGPSEQIVQQYLKLPIPGNEYAAIETPAHPYEFESGKDCKIGFDLILKKDISLSMSYSIDFFRPGYGWELILLNEAFEKLNCHLGRNACYINIKQLPLAPGNYYLNIFVQSFDTGVDNSKIESRSWTYGNGLEFYVTGKPTSGCVVLPWKITSRVLHG